jgi:hypothetical protein
MLRRMAVVKTDVSEECIASIINVTEIGELEVTLAVTSKGSTLHIIIRSSEASVLARATRRPRRRRSST